MHILDYLKEEGYGFVEMEQYMLMSDGSYCNSLTTRLTLTRRAGWHTSQSILSQLVFKYQPEVSGNACLKF